MGRLFDLLADHWPEDTRLAAFFNSFGGDIGPAGASLPLRLSGGLHALVLNGANKSLADVYPPVSATDDALRLAVLQTLVTHEAFLLDWVQSPPQTNDVRRSAALMLGAAVAAQHTDLPVWLSEVGASGGLNLYWDRYITELPSGRIGPKDAALTLAPQWTGPAPPATLPRIADRRGVDLNPLDPTGPNGLLRLTAYLWPDQPERLALTRSAVSVAAPVVDRGDAIDWLETRLKTAPEGHLHLIQQSVAWQYFPPDKQASGQAMIEAAGKNATPSRPLCWLAMESDGDTKGAIGAALTFRFWPGNFTLHLGRVDFHGRWINWTGPPA